jgi:archaellum biogenesis protein FlaJ (TadC family)
MEIETISHDVYNRAWHSLWSGGTLEEYLRSDYDTYKSNFEKAFNCTIHNTDREPRYRVRFNSPAAKTFFLLKWS